MITDKMILIVNTLFHANGFCNINEICSQLNISERTLKYNLDKVNYILKKNMLTPISISKSHIIFSVEDKNQISRLLNNPQNSYILSSEERKSMLILILGLYSGQHISLNYLCQILDMNKNTVLNDLNKVKAQLLENQIQLTNKSNSGYFLIGNELTIRYLLIETWHTLNTKPVRQLLYSLLSESLSADESGKNHLGFQHLYDVVKEVISRAESSYQLNYSHKALDDISVYIMMIYFRSLMQKNICVLPYDELTQTPEYDASVFILDELNSQGIHIPSEEINYICTVLLGSKTSDNTLNHTNQPLQLCSMIYDLISSFEMTAAIKFSDQEILFHKLFLHLKPMYYRLMYNIYADNPFSDEIIKMYPELFQITEIAVSNVEKKYAITIPRAEKAYLCIYFYSHLAVNNTTTSEVSMSRILVVCTTGIGTSILLKHQLRNLFGKHCEINTTDLRSLSQISDIDDYSLIVSTVELTDNSFPHIIEVSPILTSYQKDRLLDWYLKNTNLNKTNINIGELLYIIKKFASIENKEMLISNLQTYFGESESPNLPLHLKHIFTLGDLVFCNEPLTWQDAVRFSCLRLLNERIIDELYIHEVLDIIQKYGPYAELYPGILLVHNKPSSSIKKVSLQMTLFKHPILFEEYNTSIKLMVTLAVQDNDSHLLALQELVQLFSNEKLTNHLLNLDADSVSEQALYHSIVSQL